MIWRGLRAFMALSYLCINVFTLAQPGDRQMAISRKSRILDLIFPVDSIQEPYSDKQVLRYGDSTTQITLVNYGGGNGGHSEVIIVSLQGQPPGGVSGLISNMVATDPQVTDQEIVSQLKLSKIRFLIDNKVLGPALMSLKQLRISPILVDRACVEDCFEYEYRYDNWEESVHYVLVGPMNNHPQDRLVQWMLKFRSTVNAIQTLSKPRSRN